MPKIFFCYRRDDSSYQAGRLFDHLSLHFGPNEVFKDVDSIPLGRDFRRVLAEKVGQCDVLLALVGDGWLSAVDPDGTGRRLDDPADFVRIEIETALLRDIPVIPVLVGRRPLPPPEALPEGLREFAFRHGLPIRPDPDFHRDIERLIRGISEIAPGVAPTTQVSSPIPDLAAIEPAAIAEGGKIRLARPPEGDSRRFAAVCPSGTVRIGILKSGNATYVNDIEAAFLSQLNADLSAIGYRPAPSHDCVEWGADQRSKWSMTVNRLLARGGKEGFRYLVAIGTQAAVAFQEALGPDFGAIPTIFLGVTYPKLTGIVDSEHYRAENKQVAGVRFGCGLDAIASLLSNRLFEHRQLYFVYQEGIPQDEMAHQDLATTRLARMDRLRFIRLQRGLQEGDLSDPEAVYFSWYTFTRLFHEEESSILADRLVISIMPDNVRDGLAIAGVGTDHEWIGRRGSEFVTSHVDAPMEDKPDWGRMDVVVSPLVYWLNAGIARRKGISFSAQALAGAREIFE